MFLKWHQTNWSRIFFLRVCFLKSNIKSCCTIILPVFYGCEAEGSTWGEVIREQSAEKWICSLGGESGWRADKIGKWRLLWFTLLTIYLYSHQIKEDELAWHVLRVGKKRNIYRVWLEKLKDRGFGGLEGSVLPLVPKFAGSNPAEAVGFFRAKKSSARLPSEGK